MTSVPTTRPPVGFRPWLDPYGFGGPRPSHFDVVEVWMEPWRRPDSQERKLLQPAHLHGAFNIAGLWWRPVKSFGEYEN